MAQALTDEPNKQALSRIDTAIEGYERYAFLLEEFGKVAKNNSEILDVLKHVKDLARDPQ